MKVSVSELISAPISEFSSGHLGPRDLEVRACPRVDRLLVHLHAVWESTAARQPIEAVISVTGRQVPGCDSPVEGL